MRRVEKKEPERAERETERGKILSNIIHNIRMASIVITDREIKFISSDANMTGASIG
jgi:hypothetical protein